MAKEHPILFSDEMVRAILDGRKTQTRRPVKVAMPESFQPSLDWLYPMEPTRQSFGFWLTDTAAAVSPFGGPGDHLWVRECWAPYDTDKLEAVRVAYRASYDPTRVGSAQSQGATQQFTVPHHIAMEASHAIGLFEAYGEKWRPNIHMPRWACRLTPEVTDVRVERVQDITEEDAAAEGVRWGTYEPHECRVCARGAFMDLWNAIYAKKGFGWDDNPRVWVCDFRQREDSDGNH